MSIEGTDDGFEEGRVVSVTGRLMLRVGNHEVVEMPGGGMAVEIVSKRRHEHYGWLYEGKPANAWEVADFNRSVMTKAVHRHHDAFLWGDAYQARHGHLYFGAGDVRHKVRRDEEPSPPRYR